MKRNQEVRKEALIKSLYDNIADKIEEFNSLNVQIKQLENKSKPLQEEIKEYFKSNNIEKLESDNCKATLSTIIKENYIEFLLIQKLKEIGRNDLIHLKETVDIKEFEREVYQGNIDEKIANSCKNVNNFFRLVVTNKKK